MGEILLTQATQSMNNDGTGIGICSSENLFIKHYLKAAKFVYLKETMDYLRKHGSSHPLIGHVRHATNGDKKDSHYIKEDAHPFVYGNIMGAHNGHFGNYKEVIEEQELDLEKATIDSAAFFCSLAKELENQELNVEALNRTIKEFEGSFTMLIHDTLQPGIIWAAKGSNLLSSYLWEELGLLILATSSQDIKNAICSFIPRYNLYRNKNLSEPKSIIPTTLAARSLYRIEGLNIEKVADLEPCKTSISSYQYSRQTGTGTKPKLDQLRAEALIELGHTLGIENYGELDVTFKAANIEKWWEAAPTKLYNVLLLVEDYLTNVLELKKSNEKLDALTELWTTCKELYKLIVDYDVDAMDCYLGITILIEELESDFHVPYFFNSIETLEGIRDNLINLVSSPVEGNNG